MELITGEFMVFTSWFNDAVTKMKMENKQPPYSVRMSRHDYNYLGLRGLLTVAGLNVISEAIVGDEVVLMFGETKGAKISSLRENDLIDLKIKARVVNIGNYDDGAPKLTVRTEKFNHVMILSQTDIDIMRGNII